MREPARAPRRSPAIVLLPLDKKEKVVDDLSKEIDEAAQRETELEQERDSLEARLADEEAREQRGQETARHRGKRGVVRCGSVAACGCPVLLSPQGTREPEPNSVRDQDMTGVILDLLRARWQSPPDYGLLDAIVSSSSPANDLRQTIRDRFFSRLLDVSGGHESSDGRTATFDLAGRREKVDIPNPAAAIGFLDLIVAEEP